MLAMWPRNMRMAQFHQVLRAQQSPCFSSGTNLWALKYFKHFWNFDGFTDGSDYKKVLEERIVAGEDVLYAAGEKNKSDARCSWGWMVRKMINNFAHWPKKTLSAAHYC